MMQESRAGGLEQCEPGILKQDSVGRHRDFCGSRVRLKLRRMCECFARRRGSCNDLCILESGQLRRVPLD